MLYWLVDVVFASDEAMLAALQPYAYEPVVVYRDDPDLADALQWLDGAASGLDVVVGLPGKHDGRTCRLQLDPGEPLVVTEVGFCASPRIAALVALPTHAERRAVLVEWMSASTDPDVIAREAGAMAVITALDETGRTDVSILRLFLRAAFSTDPQIRADAVAAAKAGGDPPVGRVAASQASTLPIEANLVEVRELPAGGGPKVPLARESVHVVDGGMIGGVGWVSVTDTWVVREDRKALSLRQFAMRIDDEEALGRARRGNLHSALCFGAGVALMGVGFGEAAVLGPIPDDIGPAEIGRENWKRFGWKMVGVSGVSIAISAPIITYIRHRQLPRYYSASEADDAIMRYNAGESPE